MGSAWAYASSLQSDESLDHLAVFLNCCLLHVGGGRHPRLLHPYRDSVWNVSKKDCDSPFAKPDLGQSGYLSHESQE